jgi:hypothetical protein
MSARTPHWLSEGTDRCHACAHAHAYELTVRCVACDRATCLHCIVIERTTGEAWCPACRDAEDED